MKNNNKKQELNLGVNYQIMLFNRIKEETQQQPRSLKQENRKKLSLSKMLWYGFLMLIGGTFFFGGFADSIVNEQNKIDRRQRDLGNH